MRVSNYIFTAFFAFIFLTTMGLHIDSKIYGEYNFVSFVSPPKKIASFSVIVAEPNSKFYIQRDSVNSLHIESYRSVRNDSGNSKEFRDNESVYQFPDYKVIGDTLYISKNNNRDKVVLKTSSAKKIIGRKNSHIHFYNFKTDSLSIILDQARASGSFNTGPIDYIDIIASNKSVVNIQKLIFNSRDMRTDRSKARNLCKAHKMNAVLRSKSELISSYIYEELYIDADSSSKYSLRHRY